MDLLNLLLFSRKIESETTASILYIGIENADNTAADNTPLSPAINSAKETQSMQN